MFANELLAFCEATEVFSKSKSITFPNVSGLFGLLIEQLDSLIDEAFYAVVKTHKHRSIKIYNSELTMTKILNQV